VAVDGDRAAAAPAGEPHELDAGERFQVAQVAGRAGAGLLERRDVQADSHAQPTRSAGGLERPARPLEPRIPRARPARSGPRGRRRAPEEAVPSGEMSGTVAECARSGGFVAAEEGAARLEPGEAGSVGEPARDELASARARTLDRPRERL